MSKKKTNKDELVEKRAELIQQMKAIQEEIVELTKKIKGGK